MPYPRKVDPVKFCMACNKLLARKRVNGRLEDRNVFLRRKTCGRSCMALAYEGVIKVPNPKNSRRQAAKTVAERCTRCGRGETRLSVHHRDENPLNNALSNLESLCGSCHKLEHNRLATESNR